MGEQVDAAEVATAPPVAVHVSGSGNLYMTELGEQLVDAARRSGRRARLCLDELPVTDGAVHLVVAPHEFFPLHAAADDELVAAAARAVCVNTEQPGTPFFEAAVDWCRRGPVALDINAAGARALAVRGCLVQRLPLGYVPDRDRWHGAHGDRSIDVVHLGDDSERRRGFVATHAQLLGDLRTELRFFRSDAPVRPGRPGFLPTGSRIDLLATSRVLLNIHRGEQRYFEWVRVLDAVANGCLVATETSSDREPFRAGVHLLEAPLEHLMDEVAGILSAEPLRRRMVTDAYEALRADLTFDVLLDEALRALPIGGVAA